MTNQSSWYYAQEGKRLGPFNEDEIRRLMETATIRRDSLVWREGLADWTPAYQTDIRHLFGPAAPPPPLTGESVNNAIVWTVAFVPILAVLLEDILARTMQSPRSNFWWVPVVLNIALCLADERNLKNAGHDTKGMTIWAVLLVPVYLFVRASRLKQNNGYALVWLATFFISLFIYYPSISHRRTSSINNQTTGRTEENSEAPATAPPSTISEDIKVMGGMRETEYEKMIVGYVHNRGTRTYRWVQLSFSLYHHEEQVGTTFADFYNLEPGKSQDFQVRVSESNATDFKLSGVRAPLGY
jgi:hypothetical protein